MKARLTEAVCRSIERVDRYSIPPVTGWQNALEQLGVRPEPVGPEQAAALANEDFEGEYLLAGRVRMLSARSDCDEALLEAVLIPVGRTPPPGKPVTIASGERLVSDDVAWPPEPTAACFSDSLQGTHSSNPLIDAE